VAIQLLGQLANKSPTAIGHIKAEFLLTSEESKTAGQQKRVRVKLFFGRQTKIFAG